MNLVESLWQPNPKELASGRIVQSRWWQSMSALTAATTISSNLSQATPVDTARWITHVGGDVTPGAAQSALWALFEVFLPGGTTTTYRVGTMPPIALAAAALWAFALPLSDALLLRPGDYFWVRAGFSGGVAANALNVIVSGYDTPIGNLQ